MCRFGVSRALYEEFLRPLLLVGLFAPPEELSAAAVLGTFYFYSAALHQHGLQWNAQRSSKPFTTVTHSLVARYARSYWAYGDCICIVQDNVRPMC